MVAEKRSVATSPGRSFPLGAKVSDGGVNSSLFSRGASSVELLFFDRDDDSHPSRTIVRDPALNRTYSYWHAFISGIQPGQFYGYRVNGPWNPGRGSRFDATKLLLDPYAESIAIPQNYNREALREQGDNLSVAMKGIVVDPRAYNWEGDLPLRRPCAQTLIYEMHVRDLLDIPARDLKTARWEPKPVSSRRSHICNTSV